MKMKQLWSSASTLLLALILASCGAEEEKKTERKSDAIPVRVATLEKTEWSRPVTASGRFAAEDENMLAFKIGGIIDRIYVKEGDPIARGQLLAKLNPTEIASATAQAKAGLEKAERDFERTTRLHADSVATLEQLQNTETALALAREQYASANFNKSYSEIRALADGYVLLKLASDGEVIAGGMPVLRTSGSAGKWKLDVGLSGRDWAAIVIGDSAIIASDALPGISIQSTVARKSKSAQLMSGSFGVELSVDPKYAGRLASGMFGKATIYPSATQNGWAIPYSALLDANAGKGYVFTLENDSTAKRLEVEIGAISDDVIMITSGLENSSALIVSGSPYLSDGSKIEIVKSEKQ
jgi:RND family efflux transporter MFP subunit